MRVRTLHGQLMATTSLVLAAAVVLSVVAVFANNVLHAGGDTRRHLLAETPLVVAAVRRYGPAAAARRLAESARDIGGGVSVYTSAGRLIAHGGTHAPQRFVAAALADLDRSAPTLDVREVVSHGRRILVAFDPVYVPARQEQYLVILNAPVRPLPPSVRDVAPLIVASVLALILAQLLWAVVIRRLTRPLEAMSAWAARLAAGDLAARPEVSEGVEELRRLAASLTRLAETLSAEHDRREAFLAEVAHDLRTPLSVQRTLLMSLGRAGEPGVDVPRLARQMQAETERLIRLVNNLLDMARLEAGSVPLERERLDLREPVAMAAASFEVLARGRGVRLAMALGDAPVPAFADADRVTQIVTNLIDNAVRHAGDGGHVEVRTALDERRERALLEVVDSGPGVAPGARRTLWQRFGGGGLGLAISRALARAMDGDLELAPELPTRFVLSLPARPAP